MPKITDYPKVSDLPNGSTFIADTENGTVGILAEMLAKSLLGKISAEDFAAKLEINALSLKPELSGTDAFVIEDETGLKKILGEALAKSLLDLMPGDDFMQKLELDGLAENTTLVAAAKLLVEDTGGIKKITAQNLASTLLDRMDVTKFTKKIDVTKMDETSTVDLSNYILVGGTSGTKKLQAKKIAKPIFDLITNADYMAKISISSLTAITTLANTSLLLVEAANGTKNKITIDDFAISLIYQRSMMVKTNGKNYTFEKYIDISNIINQYNRTTYGYENIQLGNYFNVDITYNNIKYRIKFVISDIQQSYRNLLNTTHYTTGNNLILIGFIYKYTSDTKYEATNMVFDSNNKFFYTSSMNTFFSNVSTLVYNELKEKFWVSTFRKYVETSFTSFTSNNTYIIPAYPTLLGFNMVNVTSNPIAFFGRKLSIFDKLNIFDLYGVDSFCLPITKTLQNNYEHAVIVKNNRDLIQDYTSLYYTYEINSKLKNTEMTIPPFICAIYPK